MDKTGCQILKECPYFIYGCCQKDLLGDCSAHKCDLEIIRELDQKLQAKEQECEELIKEKMKLIDNSIKQKCKIKELVDENATKEVIYKVNGKCVKTVANKIKEIRKIVEGKDCKYSRYKQALDEIEKIINDDYYQDGWGTLAIKIDSIKDIINKAKGE